MRGVWKILRTGHLRPPPGIKRKVTKIIGRG